MPTRVGVGVGGLGRQGHEGDLVGGVLADAEEADAEHLAAQRHADDIDVPLGGLVDVADSEGDVTEPAWDASDFGTHDCLLGRSTTGSSSGRRGGLLERRGAGPGRV